MSATQETPSSLEQLHAELEARVSAGSYYSLADMKDRLGTEEMGILDEKVKTAGGIAQYIYERTAAVVTNIHTTLQLPLQVELGEEVSYRGSGQTISIFVKSGSTVVAEIEVNVYNPSMDPAVTAEVGVLYITDDAIAAKIQLGLLRYNQHPITD